MHVSVYTYFVYDLDQSLVPQPNQPSLVPQQPNEPTSLTWSLAMRASSGVYGFVAEPKTVGLVAEPKTMELFRLIRFDGVNSY